MATLTAELGSRTLYNSVTLDLTLNLILAQTPTIQLTSSLAVGEINFNVNIDLNEETLLIDLMLQAGNGIELQLPSDQYFASDVYINSIQGLMGVDFDKCEAEVGIAAAFGFNTSPSGTPSSDLVTSLLPTNQQPVTGSVPAPSAWECALVVGLGADLVPDLDLALLSIDQISLAELCPLLCPLVPTSAAQALNGIYLSNVLLYWCDDLPGSFASLNLSLPGYGTALPTGFIFQGGLTWGSFSAFADITVDSKHCSGQLSLSPFSIGDILSISGDGPGWTSPDGSQTIGKGGPQVQFDTTADPDYLSATWNVQFLGLIEAELEVTLSSTELDLSISAQIGSLASGSFDCQLDPAGGWFNFSCSGKFDDSGDYSVGVNTGPYAETISLLDCEFSASLAVTVSDDDISWTVEGSLQYLGLTLQIPSYTGDFALATVDDILKAVWSAIVANVERVFENILNDIQALAKELGKDVLKLVDKVVDDIKAFYDWLTGHSDKPAWLQSGAMLMSQAGVYFQVSDYQGNRRFSFVPHITEPYLQPKKVYQNMDPVIAGLAST